MRFDHSGLEISSFAFFRTIVLEIIFAGVDILQSSFGNGHGLFFINKFSTKSFAYCKFNLLEYQLFKYVANYLTYKNFIHHHKLLVRASTLAHLEMLCMDVLTVAPC